MGFFDIFRRPPPVRDVAGLADFIDQQAAFVAQKGIYEYSRARAGHYAKVLFKEPEFHTAADVSRWQTFPLGLAMVGELVEGVLLPAWPADRPALNDAVRTMVLAVFDRYPVPKALDAQTWERLRAELDQRLKRMVMHPPKFAMDIPEPFWERYFDLMPIHEKMRTRDAPTTRSYLRVTMINIHDQLTKRMDIAAVIAALSAPQRAPL
jgi:hypothetical protein